MAFPLFCEKCPFKVRQGCYSGITKMSLPYEFKKS